MSIWSLFFPVFFLDSHYRENRQAQAYQSAAKRNLQPDIGEHSVAADGRTACDEKWKDNKW